MGGLSRDPIGSLLTTAGDMAIRGTSGVKRAPARDLMPISVKEPRFGAVGDGVTDDTAAIVAALDVASSGVTGGAVFFPSGRYLISQTLIHKPGVKIFGVGAGTPPTQPGTELLASSSLNGPLIQGASVTDSSVQHHSALCDIKINHTAAAGGSYAVVYGATGETLVIDRLMVVGAYGHGLSIIPNAGCGTSTPLHLGKISVHTCGRGGSGSGLYLKGQGQTAVLVEYVGGDNHADALIELDTLNTASTVHIHAFKSERWSGYTKNPWVILVRNGYGGSVSIGVGRIHWLASYVGAETPAVIRLKDAPARPRVLGSITWDTAEAGLPSYLIYSDNTGTVPHVTASDGIRRAVDTFPRIMPVGNASYALGLGGHQIFLTDNSYDIGASGATRPRDLFLGRNARISGNLGVGNSAAATTLGSVVRKVEVFDASGNPLSFVPVYNSIT